MKLTSHLKMVVPTVSHLKMVVPTISWHGGNKLVVRRMGDITFEVEVGHHNGATRKSSLVELKRTI